MKNKNSGFFWTSYSDLMTSLFFIMLVLYVLTYIMLKLQQQATENELKEIKEITTATNKLPSKYFDFQEEFKRFSLKEQIQFNTGDSKILTGYYSYLMAVGKSIDSLITELKNKYKEQNIKYLIVIEGMASNDGYQFNHELSYLRALSLYKFWRLNGIVFDPKICELQIAGSGTGGVGRYSGTDEVKNQRFLIQIIPKINKLELHESK